jgi:DNA replication protein DnaC
MTTNSNEPDNPVVQRIKMDTTTLELKCDCGVTFTVTTVLFDGKPMFVNPRCPKCQAKVEAEQQAEKHRQQERQERERRAQREKIWENICPPLYRNTDLKHPSFTRNRAAVTTVGSWQYGANGLMLVGDTGSGKTRLAFSLLRRLHDEGKTISAFDCLGFGHAVEKYCGEFKIESWSAWLANRDVVFFDDFGKTRFTERVESEMFGVIERRVANLKPVILTTQLTTREVGQLLRRDIAEATIRRLKDFCQVVEMTKGKP